MESPATRLFLFDNVLWMGWNALLGLIPYLLAIFLFRDKIKLSIFWFLGFFAFLAFLPNAPYILTDILHLYTVSVTYESTKIVFFAIWQYILFILIGAFLFGDAYARFEHFVVARFNLPHKAMRFAIFVFMGIGVYLGRFVRLNSWDLLTDPMAVIGGFAHLISLHAVVYIALFTLLLYLIYFLFERLHQHTHPHLHTHKQ